MAMVAMMASTANVDAGVMHTMRAIQTVARTILQVDVESDRDVEQGPEGLNPSFRLPRRASGVALDGLVQWTKADSPEKAI